MTETTITFDAVMFNVQQDIEIYTDDTPEEFVDKLNKGEYFTTLEGDHVLDLEGNGVGKITDTEVSGSYDNFAVRE